MSASEPGVIGPARHRRGRLWFLVGFLMAAAAFVVGRDLANVAGPKPPAAPDPSLAREHLLNLLDGKTLEPPNVGSDSTPSRPIVLHRDQIESLEALFPDGPFRFVARTDRGTFAVEGFKGVQLIEGTKNEFVELLKITRQ